MEIRANKRVVVVEERIGQVGARSKCDSNQSGKDDFEKKINCETHYFRQFKIDSSF